MERRFLESATLHLRCISVPPFRQDEQDSTGCAELNRSERRKTEKSDLAFFACYTSYLILRFLCCLLKKCQTQALQKDTSGPTTEMADERSPTTRPAISVTQLGILTLNTPSISIAQPRSRSGETLGRSVPQERHCRRLLLLAHQLDVEDGRYPHRGFPRKNNWTPRASLSTGPKKSSSRFSTNAFSRTSFLAWKNRPETPFRISGL